MPEIDALKIYLETINNVINIDIEQKNVLIIGCPASGKTYLSNLFKTTHTKIHTDDYMRFGYVQSLYQILSDLKEINGLTIIEGIQGYRLLRKGVQLDCYYPDIVIEMIISEQKMINTYRNERDARKIKYLINFNSMHNKIIADYFALSNNTKPEWYKIHNNY